MHMIKPCLRLFLSDLLHLLTKPFQLLELSSWSSEGIHLSITFKALITREVLEFEAGFQSACTVPFACASSVACTKRQKYIVL